MDLFSKILSKDEINYRFCQAINLILSKHKLLTKASLAESLGAKTAKFSEILNGRMKAGADMLAVMCDMYLISPDWLLMSRGPIFREKSTLPPIIHQDPEEPNYTPEASSTPTKEALTAIAPLMELIDKKDCVIKEQAESIGRLKAEIEILKAELGKNILAHTHSHAGIPEVAK